MAKFAKLIELDDEQVLLTLNYNDDEERDEVTIRTDFDSHIARITLGFDSDEKAMKMLNDYTEEKAKKFRSSMVRMFKK